VADRGQGVLFLAAFVPRALYPVSRPVQWYERSFRFVAAVFQGQWAATVVLRAPWCDSDVADWAGAARLVCAGQSGGAIHPSAGDRRAVIPDRGRGQHPAPGSCDRAGVLLVWRLLKGLLGEPVAWAGAGFLALDPFHIAISKVVHLDALLSMLMILSALSVLRYLQFHGAAERPQSFWSRYRLLLVSGVLAGLAFLTKSPAYLSSRFLD